MRIDELRRRIMSRQFVARTLAHLIGLLIGAMALTGALWLWYLFHSPLAVHK
jgi:hypothetical protein